jgi:N-acetylglucosamine kinase-like BadF-type ATPase
MDVSRRTFLALDGGGTKTFCLVADARGRLLGFGAGGGANANIVPAATARRSILDAVEGAWAESEAAGPPAQVAISGPTLAYVTQTIGEVTGAGTTSRVGEWEAAWASVRPWLAPDMPRDVAVMVDAGTGSTAGGMNRDGRRATVGGWGWLLGDEGSGFWIGLQAVQAAIWAEDGRGRPTALGEAICAALDLPSLHALIPLVYQSAHGESLIASLAPTVAAVAGAGDRVASDMLAEAGRELARMVTVVIRRLGIGAERFAVIPFGSVFKAGPLILAPFREGVRLVAPGANIVLPRYESVVGTLLVAMERGGVAVPDVWPTLAADLARYPRLCL